MSPFVQALLIVGPAAFLAGFLIRPFIVPQPNLRSIIMAVFQEFVQPLADLQAAVVALPDKIAALGNPQDKADTIAAVLPALQAATDAINGIGAPGAGQ